MIGANVREESDSFLSPHTPDWLISEATLGEFMRTVQVNVEVEPQAFPIEAPDGGMWRISVTGATNESQDVVAPTATFVLSAGEYTALAQRLDTTGVGIGPVASAPFTVVDLTKQVDVAKTVTVTFV